MKQGKQEETRPKAIIASDFIHFGMEAELMGRVGQYIPLEGLTTEDLRRIMLESELSIYRQYQKFFLNQGIQLEFGSKRIDELVEKALERGTGARGLNALVEEAVEPLLFKVAASGWKKSTCGEARRDRHAG